MNNFVFKRIFKDDERQVRNLVNNVFENLERKDFLIPWTEEQMDRFFDGEYKKRITFPLLFILTRNSKISF